MGDSMTLAACLDLGTTRIKAAQITREGRLTNLLSEKTPPITGKGLIRETNPEAYLETAISLLAWTMKSLPKDIPMGLASQRSSFLLWEKETGKPVTPIISWQDRRAHDFCIHGNGKIPNLSMLTGLLMSPHYAGPKLAHMISMDKSLRRRIDSGDLMFGNLDTFFIWRTSNEKIFQTDITMAARTLMVDINIEKWSSELLEFMDISQDILPNIAPTFGNNIPLATGGILTASVSDQAAGLVSVLNQSPDSALVNLGTGGFVIAPIEDQVKGIKNYLKGPVCSKPNEQTLFALEGTINGIAEAVNRYGTLPVELLRTDPIPKGFCLPDTTGVGAPYWRADIPFSLSQEIKQASAQKIKQAVLEGIIFRICRIIRDIQELKSIQSILLSGGLSQDSFIQQGIAACSGIETMILEEKESTLMGAASLALGLKHIPISITPVKINKNAGVYLKDKYFEWELWLKGILKS